MRLTILIVIVALGLLMPLFWIVGTVAGIIYHCRHRVGATAEEQLAAVNPQLGLTMADGGDVIDNAKKK